MFIGWLYQLPWKLKWGAGTGAGHHGRGDRVARVVDRPEVDGGWAAFAFVLVGLNPPPLAWERFAMTERMLMAFLITLIVWLVLCAADRAR